jgi:hypothetical protein
MAAVKRRSRHRFNLATLSLPTSATFAAERHHPPFEGNDE